MRRTASTEWTRTVDGRADDPPVASMAEPSQNSKRTGTWPPRNCPMSGRRASAARGADRVDSPDDPWPDDAGPDDVDAVDRDAGDTDGSRLFIRVVPGGSKWGTAPVPVSVDVSGCWRWRR
jgi:hypothetical protein